MLTNKAKSDLSTLPIASDGSFKRPDSTFRNFIEEGGKFEPEKGRYYLYVVLGCPWATRTLIVRKLKGLEEIIRTLSLLLENITLTDRAIWKPAISMASPRMDSDGWPFASVDNFPGATDDPLYGSQHVKDLYLKADPNYEGRFTVPVLWDKKNLTIVNNESSEIIRIFNTAFDEFVPEEKRALNLYPEALRAEIDELNAWVYTGLNNGVYRAGFAASQEAYSRAVKEVFESLDKVEKIIAGKEYLVGGKLTEADVRLFVTIIRFDVAYHGVFKCNIRTIRDGYPNIDRWLKNLYWKNPAFKDSTDFDHIKTGYYWSTKTNPSRIVPVGPVPHIRPL